MKPVISIGLEIYTYSSSIAADSNGIEAAVLAKKINTGNDRRLSELKGLHEVPM